MSREKRMSRRGKTATTQSNYEDTDTHTGTSSDCSSDGELGLDKPAAAGDEVRQHVQRRIRYKNYLCSHEVQYRPGQPVRINYQCVHTSSTH